MGQWVRRAVSFSGCEWLVKGSDSAVGPGPNRFSDEAHAVWVDDAGQLHLQIGRHDGVWQCAEIVSRQSFGYGEYVFHLGGGADEIDENAVLGLFTWDTERGFHNREIDIEVSRWGKPTNENGQFVVQPHGTPGNVQRFPMRLQGTGSTHRFEWRPDRLDFSSRTEAGSMIARWSYTGPDVPPHGKENVRVNLWLFRGIAPSDGKEVEAVVRRFEFRPLE